MIIKAIKRLMFPGYFGQMEFESSSSRYFAGEMISSIVEELKKEILVALRYGRNVVPECEELADEAERISFEFAGQLPEIQRVLLTDIQAAFDGDPASGSKEAIIFSYPGFNAIFTYRIAHELYVRNVPFIPRMMTEYAHSRTGIDINPGAVIGEYFFIDHGTGVVIGETTEIGKNVKIYQGVTLGALSTRMGQLLKGVKRHPTIKDNVTIYSNASILGGETVIGENCTIGGNAFITEPVPANTLVSMKNPELTFRGKEPKQA
jgi:serine O-acetyltransferase